MMDRWGLSGMRSFEQAGVKRKEGDRLQRPDASVETQVPA